MRSRLTPLVVIGLLLALIACRQASTELELRVPPLADLQCVAEHHEVDPTIGFLCTGLSEAHAAALTERYGPHSPLGIDIYTNHRSLAALQVDGDFPPGSWIVKVQRPVAIGALTELGWGKELGAMRKMEPGYDPEHGDWAYVYRDADGGFESGRVQRCIACHAQVPRQVFAAWWPVRPLDESADGPWFR